MPNLADWFSLHYERNLAVLDTIQTTDETAARIEQMFEDFDEYWAVTPQLLLCAGDRDPVTKRMLVQLAATLNEAIEYATDRVGADFVINNPLAALGLISSHHGYENVRVTPTGDVVW